MPTTVGSHSVAAFVNPSNGDALDATVVKGNDNTLRTAYVNHDADPGVHVQSSVLASRPAAGVVGRKWMTTDGGVRLWYDTGSVWEEVSYLQQSSGTTNAVAKFTGATSIGDSQIQDNGTGVGIGGAPDNSFKVKVHGATTVTGSIGVNGVNYTWPSVNGSANSALVNNGSGTLSWATPASFVDVQTFNSAGTWTKPSLGSVAMIEVWGGGGGGARGSTSIGGSGGGYQRYFVPLSLLASTVSVTVGAGGIGTATDGPGSDGGNSIFVANGINVVGGFGQGGLNGTADLLRYGGNPRNFGGNLRSDGINLPTVTQLAAAIAVSDRLYNGGFGGNAPSLLAGSVHGGGAGAGTNSIPAGTSTFAGNGGALNANGVAPAGGGGAATSGTSGNGADGRVIVTVW
jgi:hypothetical protein